LIELWNFDPLLLLFGDLKSARIYQPNADTREP
jgi:hypothetical protein